jgi:hypothetical protein
MEKLNEKYFPEYIVEKTQEFTDSKDKPLNFYIDFTNKKENKTLSLFTTYNDTNTLAFHFIGDISYETEKEVENEYVNFAKDCGVDCFILGDERNNNDSRIIATGEKSKKALDMIRHFDNLQFQYSQNYFQLADENFFNNFHTYFRVKLEKEPTIIFYRLERIDTGNQSEYKYNHLNTYEIKSIEEVTRVKQIIIEENKKTKDFKNKLTKKAMEKFPGTIIVKEDGLIICNQGCRYSINMEFDNETPFYEFGFYDKSLTFKTFEEGYELGLSVFEEHIKRIRLESLFTNNEK